MFVEKEYNCSYEDAKMIILKKFLRLRLGRGCRLGAGDGRRGDLALLNGIRRIGRRWTLLAKLLPGRSAVKISRMHPTAWYSALQGCRASRCGGAKKKP